METWLVEKYNCEVVQLVVRRIYGLRWRLDKEESEDATRALAPGAPTPSSLRVIHEFVREQCRISTASDAHIDMETRLGPDGELRDGFRARKFTLRACFSRGHVLSCMRSAGWIPLIAAPSPMREYCVARAQAHASQRTARSAACRCPTFAPLSGQRLYPQARAFRTHSASGRSRGCACRPTRRRSMQRVG